MQRARQTRRRQQILCAPESSVAGGDCAHEPSRALSHRQADPRLCSVSTLAPEERRRSGEVLAVRAQRVVRQRGERFAQLYLREPDPFLCSEAQLASRARSAVSRDAGRRHERDGAPPTSTPTTDRSGQKQDVRHGAMTPPAVTGQVTDPVRSPRCLFLPTNLRYSRHTCCRSSVAGTGSPQGR